MKSICKVLDLRWEQPHETVQVRWHPFRKQICRKAPRGPGGRQAAQASAAAAKAISILAVKAQTTDPGKDFLALVKLQLEYRIQPGEPPLQEREGHTGASPADLLIRGREKITVSA